MRQSTTIQLLKDLLHGNSNTYLLWMQIQPEDSTAQPSSRRRSDQHTLVRAFQIKNIQKYLISHLHSSISKRIASFDRARVSGSITKQSSLCRLTTSILKPHMGRCTNFNIDGLAKASHYRAAYARYASATLVQMQNGPPCRSKAHKSMCWLALSTKFCCLQSRESKSEEKSRFTVYWREEEGRTYESKK